MNTALFMRLHRFHHAPGYAISKLHVDNEFQCYVLEDEVREIETRPCQEWKIPGRTAIPSGTYEVVIDYSQRFKRFLPRLLDVPCFEGIRIHPGNTQADTEGCLLVGEWTGGDSIHDSRAQFTKLFARLMDAKQGGKKIYLEIT